MNIIIDIEFVKFVSNMENRSGSKCHRVQLQSIFHIWLETNDVDAH